MTTAVILAGGQSRRFGADKAFFKLGRYPMIQVVAELLAPIFDTVIVAGGDRERMSGIGLTCYPDPTPGKGALGGIYNGLLNTESEWIFCCGCDMPLLQSDVIRTMIDSIGDEDALIPMIEQTWQPMHAIYKSKTLRVIERLAKEAGSFLPDLRDVISIGHIGQERFESFPDWHLSFVSLNDMEKAERYKAHLPGNRPQ